MSKMEMLMALYILFVDDVVCLIMTCSRSVARGKAREGVRILWKKLVRREQVVDQLLIGWLDHS